MPAFTCPLCQNKFSVPAESSAVRVRCPHCRKAVDLPKLPRPRAATSPQATTEPAGSAQPVRRPIAVIAGLASSGLVAVVGLCAVVGYFAFRSPGLKDDPPPSSDHVVEVKNQQVIKDPPKKLVDPPPGDGPSIKKKVPEPPKDPTPPHQQWTDQFVARVNQYRHAAGLGSVRLDDELSRGCVAHATYLAKNVEAKAADSTNVYDEDPAKPGYTTEGQRTGKTALVAFMEPGPALDVWMGRLFGRLALLSAEMQTIGLGFARNTQGEWISVVDPVRGRGEPIVVYPAPKQRDVPLSFSGGPEVPDAKAVGGFPITVTFPPTMQIADAALALTDAEGTSVTGWTWTPAKPAAKTTGRNSIALIPRGMLRSSHVYQVKASAQVDGKPWSLAWSFTTEDDGDRDGAWAKKALAKVNAYRARANLAAVTLDDTLSRGCAAHARYLMLNADHPAVHGLGAHDEDLKLPGASDEGRTAGKASNIAIGDYEPLDGIDAWMATLYHRVPILEPNLKRVGFGCARSPRFGWISVLNVTSGRDKVDRPHAVLYPVPDQLNVPLSFPSGGEEPNPIPESTSGRAGYPITAFFPRQNALKNATGKLTNAQGDEVPCWISSREKPANPMYQQHQDTTFCLIPKEPLEEKTTYRIHLSGELAGKTWEKRWAFTTMAGGMTSAQGARQVVDRLNQARLYAGLTAVMLDEKQSHGCQRHAEYLVRNSEIIAKSNASVNDEDPLLPGFTAEGLRAGRQSDVFTNASVPVIQIDDLLATSSRRVLLLDPSLQRIGFGCAHEVGRGWRCVLDLNGGKGSPRIVLYPAPKQTDVPCAGSDRIAAAKSESLGYPITVVFPPLSNLRQAQAVLTDAEGKDVRAWLSAPDKPLGARPQPNTIALHPLAPLQPNQTYSVTVSAIVNASEWRHTWQFTTSRQGR